MLSEYETFAQELITGVRGVIELELTGAEERAVNAVFRVRVLVVFLGAT